MQKRFGGIALIAGVQADERDAVAAAAYCRLKENGSSKRQLSHREAHWLTTTGCSRSAPIRCANALEPLPTI